MGVTQERLVQFEQHMQESLGVRAVETRPRLSPLPLAKDQGRRPLRGMGRVEIERVIPDPDQPRTEFDTEALASLGENLKAKGQLHPLHVRWSESANQWVIISGERRWRAARQAGLSTVDCYFHEEPLTPAQVLELQLIENVLREDLSPVEEAQAFESLLKLNGWTGKQLAESLRIPASKITRALALLKLPAEMQAQVKRGEVPARTAYELSKLTDQAEQQRLAQVSAAGQLSTHEAARLVRSRARRTTKPRRTTTQTFFAEGNWRITVSCPPRGTYVELEQALLQALAEVRLRIDNNVALSTAWDRR